MSFDINKHFNLEGYIVTKLHEKNVSDIQNLCENCSYYFIIDQGFEPNSNTGKGILEALPPEKKYNDKYVIGIYDTSKHLIALMDIIKNYPEKNVWMLGLLLIDPSKRNKGLGTLIHNNLVNWIGNKKGKKIRIGVLSNNQKAINFWSTVGYTLIKKSELQKEEKDKKRILTMDYYLQAHNH